MFMRQVLLTLLVTVLLGGTALGQDEAVWKETALDEFRGPRHELSFSAGLRIDETRNVDAQPEFSVGYLRWLNRHTALTADLGYTYDSEFSYRSSARTFALGAGFRLQEPGGVVAVFLEPGLTLHHHRGDLNGNSFAETRLGLKLSLGASVHVFGRNHIDLSVRQVLNQPASQPIYTYPAVYPPIDGDFLGGADTYDLYNTTHVMVSYRVGL